MTDVSDHPEAMARILEADVDQPATDRGTLARQLADSDAQVTLEVASNVADAVLTEQQLTEALDGADRLPQSAAEISAAADGLADYSDPDRNQDVAEAVTDRIVTQEDLDSVTQASRSRVPTTEDLASELAAETDGQEFIGQDREQAISETVQDVTTREDVALELRQSVDTVPTQQDVAAAVEDAPGELPGVDSQTAARDVGAEIVTREDVELELAAQDGPVYREDVEAAVEQTARQRELIGSAGDTVDQVATEQGAPRQAEVQRARTQAVTSDTITPEQALDDPTDQAGIGQAGVDDQLPVVRDEGGNVVAVSGADSRKGEAVAEAVGAEYRSLEDLEDSIELEQQPGRAELTVDGRTVDVIDT